MRPLKRIFSIVLVMALVLAMGVTAFASEGEGDSTNTTENTDPTPTPTPTGRITILNPGTASYRAYKIFDVTYNRPAENTPTPEPVDGDNTGSGEGSDAGSGEGQGEGGGSGSGSEPVAGTDGENGSGSAGGTGDGTDGENGSDTGSGSTTGDESSSESGTDPVVVYTIDASSVWLEVVYDATNHASLVHGLKFEEITNGESTTGYTVTKEAGFSAESFAKYLTDRIPQGAQAIPFSGATAGFLEDGYYLVIASESDGSGLNAQDLEKAMLVTVLDGREVKVENKNDMPFDKTVDEEKVKDAKIGDTLTFMIETKIPYDVYEDVPVEGGSTRVWAEKYAYYVSDIMDEGLEFDSTSFKVKIGDSSSAVTLNVVDDENSTLSGNQVRFGKNGKTFELSLDMKALTTPEAGHQDTGFPEGTKITISYDAIVTSDVVATVAENHAVLEYGSNPEELTVKDSKALVYNYKIDVYKYDTSEDGNKLPGAKFVLYKEVAANNNGTAQEGGSAISPEPAPATEPQKLYYKETYKVLNNVTGLADGTYETVTVGEGNEAITTHYALKDGKRVILSISFVTNETDATVFTTGNDGHVTFVGLPEGTYYLEETQAPETFTRIEPIEIVLDKKDFIMPGLTDEQIRDNLTYTSNVININGVELPSTGGTGTTLFYMAGLLLAVTGFVALVIRRRISL